MEYTIQKLSQLAGVSARTLRYYDEIGLLIPARINSSGYRIYGTHEVNVLQQILFYRELEMSLEDIKKLMQEPTFDRASALHSHKKALLQRKQQIELLLENIEASIAEEEGRIPLENEKKFEGFKSQLVEENEQNYGKEIRAKYGDQLIDEANAKFLAQRPEDMERAKDLAKEIDAKLALAKENGDPTSELAREVVALHKKWLMGYWTTYSKEAHAGLAQMYVDDERFTAFYDHTVPGTAEFLRDVIVHFTKQ
ncbi:MerR family transcriptional regulator [Paenisporosarcina cavernae]|uniref:MerR family transcriptional regulator n=1 Tax=Paenisporosarcina cavernae TaxID=2320858 RepID=A0A385YUD0_9BACL|nr:MerR family transcriptional regulator [Paenisporosarcina cavernae]AYC30469.1 MerR family transcriptional regulator [Paenisporosarcina cavernae]